LLKFPSASGICLRQTHDDAAASAIVALGAKFPQISVLIEFTLTRICALF
jgi:hypothetical protein